MPNIYNFKNDMGQIDSTVQ